jgi:hypothetical protein
MTIRITPMPSPTGRNQARLFMGVLGRPAAAFAVDSARRRQARDSATSDAMDAFQEFMNEALTDPADRSKAETLLTQLLQTLPSAPPDDDDSDADSDTDQTAEDRRKKMAGDRRLDGFAEMERMFPLSKMPRQA